VLVRPVCNGAVNVNGQRTLPLTYTTTLLWLRHSFLSFSLFLFTSPLADRNMSSPTDLQSDSLSLSPVCYSLTFAIVCPPVTKRKLNEMKSTRQSDGQIGERTALYKNSPNRPTNNNNGVFIISETKKGGFWKHIGRVSAQLQSTD
jgi:hypothetical protein